MADPGSLTHRTLPEGPVEVFCRWACRLCLVGMVIIIATEIFLRLIGHSLEVSDEYSAYLLVAFTFFSLSVSLAADGFHRVELLLARLGPRGRLLTFITFNLLSLLFAGLLDIYLIRVVLQSYDQEAMAMSVMMTPLWIPQLSMPIGLSALCFSLVRVLLRDLRELKSVS